MSTRLFNAHRDRPFAFDGDAFGAADQLPGCQLGDSDGANGGQVQVTASCNPFADGTVSRNTFCARVATLFTSRPNEWVDGTELAQVGGAYAWRSRVSDLRRPPFSLNIQNRQLRVGRRIVSEYRLVVATDQGGAA